MSAAVLYNNYKFNISSVPSDVDTCQHGDVQLVPLPDSASEAAGKVEICLDGVWSNICGRGWLADDAGVVCRQLGYSAQGMCI